MAWAVYALLSTPGAWDTAADVAHAAVFSKDLGQVSVSDREAAVAADCVPRAVSETSAGRGHHN
jgi:hypothetical protein